MKKANKKSKTRRKTTAKKLWLTDHKVVVGVGLLAVFGGVALGLLMAKQANAPMAFGDGAQSTARPVSSEAKDNGRSAAAGDHGAATAGDNSPATVYNITTNADVKIIQGDYYDLRGSAFGNSDGGRRPVGAFEHSKDSLEAGLPTGIVSAIVGTKTPTELYAAVYRAGEAMSERKLSEAIERSDELSLVAESFFNSGEELGSEVKRALANSAEPVCESALYQGRYDDVGIFASKVLRVVKYPPPVMAWCYKRIGEFRAKGLSVYVPSADDIHELKTWDKQEAYAALNMMAKAGYLHPYKVDAVTCEVTKCSYRECFGFEKELEYVEPKTYTRRDGEGHDHVGYEYVAVSSGLWYRDIINLTEAYDEVSGRTRTSSDGVHVEFAKREKVEDHDVGAEYERAIVKCDFTKFEEQPGSAGYEVIDCQTLVASCSYGGAHALDPNGAKLKFGGESSSVPEPTSGVLLLLGVCGLALRRKKISLVCAA